MIELILAFFLSLMPHHTHRATDNHNSTQVTTMDDDGDTGTDIGGETEHTPPPPPPRP